MWRDFNCAKHCHDNTRKEKTQLEVVRFWRKLPLDFKHTKIQHKNQSITKQEIEQLKYRDKYNNKKLYDNHYKLPSRINANTDTNTQHKDQGNKHQETKLYNIHCIFLGPAVARLVGSSHRNRGAAKRREEDWIQNWNPSWIALNYLIHLFVEPGKKGEEKIPFPLPVWLCWQKASFTEIINLGWLAVQSLQNSDSQCTVLGDESQISLIQKRGTTSCSMKIFAWWRAPKPSEKLWTLGESPTHSVG